MGFAAGLAGCEGSRVLPLVAASFIFAAVGIVNRWTGRPVGTASIVLLVEPPKLFPPLPWWGRDTDAPSPSGSLLRAASAVGVLDIPGRETKG